MDAVCTDQKQQSNRTAEQQNDHEWIDCGCSDGLSVGAAAIAAVCLGGVLMLHAVAGYITHRRGDAAPPPTTTHTTASLSPALSHPRGERE